LALDHYHLALANFDKNYDIEGIRRLQELKIVPGKKGKDSKLFWKCIRPEPPTTKLIENEEDSDRNRDNSKHESHFTSSPNGLLRLKKAGPSSGWTLELTQDVSPGTLCDLIMVEKPFTVSLVTRQTCYCYFCFKRCHNLIPCANCPHVGFCSHECRRKAKKRRYGVEEGNCHFFDCHGLRPYTCLNSCNKWNTGVDSIHAAFSSLSKVPPNCLLDYICSKAQYECGSGHQAFVGSKKVRDKPLMFYDTFDYSSIAWLSTCSDARRDEDLWAQTVIAVFLTYCLHYIWFRRNRYIFLCHFQLGGYPMTWFDETALFFQDPSPSNRPWKIPASWLAACMLFHIQMISVNSFEFSEHFFRLSKNPKSFGICIYPTISLINHSCVPTAAVSWVDKGTLLVYSLQSLSAGSEISISYGPLIYDSTPKERQDYFQKDYFFKCKCEACSNNWDELFQQSERLKCPDCSCIFDESSDCCPECKSERAKESYKLLLDEQIPMLKGILLKENCTLGDLSRASECVKKAEAFLQLPSLVLFNVRNLFGLLVTMLYGNRVYEPWLTN
uniref:SET domain-containing protein n=1 Tax=Rodentolepis nana TaxID=102285 RepID=A0A0R3TK81_RODNA